MAFYDLTKQERITLVEEIERKILQELSTPNLNQILNYFEDNDTYIRKTSYLAIGRIYFSQPELALRIRRVLDLLLLEGDFKIRQTAINAAGEIGKKQFEIVQHIFDCGLFDPHHSPRNAVIGSIKKMGEVNPIPVLTWAKGYLHHPNKEIRREICHGIELRGRKYPLDILPMLKELQFDPTVRVRNTLVHVIGQIAYKKGCLAVVVETLKNWENKELVKAALAEIIDVHDRYKDFAVLTQEEAKHYISENYIV